MAKRKTTDVSLLEWKAQDEKEFKNSGLIKAFEILPDEAVTIEKLFYARRNREELYVKHCYLDKMGKVVSIMMPASGSKTITSLQVKDILNDNKIVYWDMELCRIVDKVVYSCKDHPTYGGKRKPRKECPMCWEFYEYNKSLK